MINLVRLMLSLSYMDLKRAVSILSEQAVYDNVTLHIAQFIHHYSNVQFWTWKCTALNKATHFIEKCSTYLMVVEISSPHFNSTFYFSIYIISLFTISLFIIELFCRIKKSNLNNLKLKKWMINWWDWCQVLDPTPASIDIFRLSILCIIPDFVSSWILKGQWACFRHRLSMIMWRNFCDNDEL